MSSSSFAESEDSVSVSTLKCREELEEMESSDGWGMYGCGSAKRMTDWTFVLYFACLVYLIRDSVPFMQWYELAEAMRGEGDIGDGPCEWRRHGWQKALCGEVVGVLVGERMRVKGMSRSKLLAGGTTNVFKCRTASGT